MVIDVICDGFGNTIMPILNDNNNKIISRIILHWLSVRKVKRQYIDKWWFLYYD